MFSVVLVFWDCGFWSWKCCCWAIAVLVAAEGCLKFWPVWFSFSEVFGLSAPSLLLSWLFDFLGDFWNSLPPLLMIIGVYRGERSRWWCLLYCSNFYFTRSIAGYSKFYEYKMSAEVLRTLWFSWLLHFSDFFWLLLPESPEAPAAWSRPPWTTPFRTSRCWSWF